MKLFTKTLLGVVTAAALVACGGGGGGGEAAPVAVTSDTTLTLNAANGAAAIQSITNQGFSFSSGVPALTGTTNATTVTISVVAGVTTYTIKDNVTNAVATGTLAFGSCIFKRNPASPFPILAAGDVTITPCNITAKTKGLTPSATDAEVEFQLGNLKATRRLTLSIDSVTGAVTVGGVKIGTAKFGNLTGTN